ncbi:hypothetical protein DQW77_02730 [Roseovarius sp. TE539]|uniref:DUF1127 domain-containing protein n=1 Tax=Roseovarius sp. TE539 TaxID=2249812 RepID=UPI000DDF790D|nr:DUF1127 domain-containing protein [Roseovarius sp. TE539]RBI76929.1 hypothetical protein DQW77_02730 [Roseovarius sp. TE539]
MAAIDTSRPHNAPTFVLGDALGRALVALKNWNDERVTRNALSRLSDRELDDIGICRGDIARISARA